MDYAEITYLWGDEYEIPFLFRQADAPHHLRDAADDDVRLRTDPPVRRGQHGRADQQPLRERPETDERTGGRRAEHRRGVHGQQCGRSPAATFPAGTREGRPGERTPPEPPYRRLRRGFHSRLLSQAGALVRTLCFPGGRRQHPGRSDRLRLARLSAGRLVPERLGSGGRLLDRPVLRRGRRQGYALHVCAADQG